MKAKRLTPEEEYELYKRPEYQEPQGPARRRKSRFTELVPVRFTPEVLESMRRLAEEEERSVSSWIRRAVDAALAGTTQARKRKTG